MSTTHGSAARAAPLVHLRWRIARGFIQRLRGLLGSAPPADGTALLIARCKAVHTVGMGYPIDIVFVARSGRVMRVCPQVVPGRARVCRRAWGVAELASGEARRLGIVIGARLVLPP